MTVERRERLAVSVSSAVFIEDGQGRILLLQQSSENKGFRWGPPGGGMEAHEDPIKNALREVEEEMGVPVELIDLIGIYTTDRGDNSGIGFVFRGKIIQGEIKLREGEIKDARFFTQAEIQELIDTNMLYKPEYNLRAIKDWSNGLSYPIDVVRPIIN